MKIETRETQITIITAADGKLLTDGVVYVRTVALPTPEAAQRWREIDEKDAPSGTDPDERPVVRYSKYKIQLSCQRLRLWEQVKEAVSSAGLTDSWYNIQDIASDNPELQSALPAIREAFGGELVDEVLAESIAD